MRPTSSSSSWTAEEVDVRIATWNVNSLNARLPRVEEWIEYAQPDVLCMQETKLADGAFPTMAFSALGYESVSTRRRPLERRRHRQPGRTRGRRQRGSAAAGDEQGARLVAATCGGVRVHSVYVPNGREVGQRVLRGQVGLAGPSFSPTWSAPTSRPTTVAVCGDFNVAPEDRDVWDPAAMSRVHPRDGSGARALCAPSRTGVSSTPSASVTARASSSRGGTTAPGTSTSTWACASTSSC